MAKSIAERSDVIPVLAEIFREHGFEGASLARISAATGLGKGSLYHFFPGGKEEMAAAVLDEIDQWFHLHVFEPLRRDADPVQAIRKMLREVRRYFLSGRKVCLLGVFALGQERERYPAQVSDYFVQWADALQSALMRAGRDRGTAHRLSEDALIAIQGGLVLARAWNQPGVFTRALDRLQTALLGS